MSYVDSSSFGQDDELLDDLLDIVSTTTAQAKKSAIAEEENEEDSELDEPGNQKEEFFDDSFDDEIDFACDGEGNFKEGDAKAAAAGVDGELEGSFEAPAAHDEAQNDQANFYVYDKMQIKSIYWRGCNDTTLPEGWVQVTHACGMPLYLNRQSRVCTMSRPYYIGQSSARKHDIPISAIPCMAYRKRKEEIDQQIKEHQQAKQGAKNASKCPFKKEASGQATEQPATTSGTSQDEAPAQQDASNKLNEKKVTVSIQTSEEKLKESMLAADKVNEYCKKLFEFDVIKVKKFKTWNDRKKFMRKAKQRKIPESSKMLKIQTKTQKGISKELNINMTNKTALSILYEYFNQVFKTNPRFEIEEKENPKDPFQAVCYINDKVCGRGTGNSKKAAKNNAAEAALCVLIPDFKSSQTDQKKNNDDLYSFFDGYNVEHSHVYSLSQKLGAPLPYDILLTCLKYNFAINMSRNTKQFIEEEIKPIKYRNCLYRMKLAQYDVEVNCSKKKEGRQLASQKILKLMHPHIQTWGSILRLYGSRMAESYLNVANKDSNAKNDENEDSNEPMSEPSSEKTQAATPSVSTGAESAGPSTSEPTNGKASATNTAIINGKAKPNRELLEKLREEMRKLRKSTTGDKPSNEDAKPKQQTLLTIPPLLLGESEFKLNSCNYLMSAAAGTVEPGATKESDDDKIMLCESQDHENATVSSGGIDFAQEARTNGKRKRRKLDDQDEEEESGEASSSTSGSDSDSDSSSSSSSSSDSE